MPRTRYFGKMIVVALAAILAIAFSTQHAIAKDNSTIAQDYQVGMGKVNITPEIESQKVTFAGYFGRMKKPATSVLDPIYAKAAVIKDPDDKKVAIVSVDLCYVNNEVRDRVVERLNSYGFHEHNLMITATHNHSGFGGYDSRLLATLLFGPKNQSSLELAVSGIVDAVINASDQLEPAIIKTAQVDLKDLNRSRRDPAFDVSTGGGENPAIPLQPDKYKADPTLTVIMFEDVKGKPKGLIFNFASHPTVLSPNSFAISAEWPGVATDMVEEHLGKGTVALFINGSLGDAAPNPDWSNVQQEKKDMENYGTMIGQSVIDILEETKPISKSEVRYRTHRRDFDRLRLRIFGGFPMPPKPSKIAYTRADQPLQVARIGELVLMAVPGEPSTAVGDRLKSLCEKRQTCIIAAPANGHLGYFVLEDEWEEGGYAPDSTVFGLHGTYKVLDGIEEAYSNVK